MALAQGEQQKASDYLEETLNIAAQLNNFGDQATALSLMGNTLVTESQCQEAGEQFRRALKIAQEIGALPLTLEIFTGIAALELFSPKPNHGQAGELLGLVQVHTAATRETHEKAERMIITEGLEHAKSELADVEMYISDILED